MIGDVPEMPDHLFDVELKTEESHSGPVVKVPVVKANLHKALLFERYAILNGKTISEYIDIEEEAYMREIIMDTNPSSSSESENESGSEEEMSADAMRTMLLDEYSTLVYKDHSGWKFFNTPRLAPLSEYEYYPLKFNRAYKEKLLRVFKDHCPQHLPLVETNSVDN